MTDTSKFYTSRIGKRMLKLYALSTLLPIILLSAFSYYFSQQQLLNSATTQLTNDQQHISNILAERLQHAATQFTVSRSITPDRIQDIVNASPEKTLFDSMGLIGEDKVIKSIFGEIPNDLVTPAYNLRFLKPDKPVMIVLTDPRQHASVYLLQTLVQSPNYEYILVAQVKNSYLFNFQEIIQRETPCIINYDGKTVYCSKSLAAKVSPILKQQLPVQNSLQQTTPINSDIDLWQITKIDLQKLFIGSNWHFFLGKSTAQISAPINSTTYLLASILLISVLLGMIFSIKHIRDYIIPLYKLKAGIRDVANRRSNAEIALKTNDEFEEIAEKFNDMSAKVSKQFDAMEMMGRIDRLILSTLDINNIIETILVRMPRIVPCDSVSMLILDEKTPHAGQLYFRHDRLSTTVHSTTVQIHKQDYDFLGKNPDHVVIENNGLCPQFLDPVKKSHVAFLVLPIFLTGNLTAAICLGYIKIPTICTEDISHARDLAHRVAVALSNAAWEDKLYHKAHYDTLTGLPNRLLFHDRLEQAITRSNRDKKLSALLFIDMDRFKFINDSLGHDIGDVFLQETANRLRSCVRSIDTVARLGGDEFTIILPDLEDNEASNQNVHAVAKKVLERLEQPYQLAGQEINSSGSIGIAIYPQDACDYSELLKNADSAMYLAKARGKSNAQFYSESINAESKALLILENQLRHALERREFELYYQPRINILTNKIVGVEALIRWNHEERGLIAPDSFIHIAEENGLITQIGAWALKTACQQIKQWHYYQPELVVAVNVSAYQFQANNLITSVQSALSVANLLPEFLEIEITEGTIMKDSDLAMQTLKTLREMKIKLAIDDFGTGYSSLSYLKRFPLDNLKIDRSFIHNLATDSENYSIVDAVITLAHNLSLSVIAEGVETEAVVETLRQLNCDEVQGFVYAKPLPASEFLAFVERFNGKQILRRSA